MTIFTYSTKKYSTRYCNTTGVSPGSLTMYFSGANSYINVESQGNSFALSNSSFTIEVWVDMRVDVTNDYFIDTRNDAATNNWAFLFNGSGNLAFYDGTTFVATASSTGFTTKGWTHIAYVRDWATGNGAIYVDGTRVALVADAKNYSVTPTTVTIGSRYTPTGYYSGYLYELRITKNQARYSGASFTKPTRAFTVDANTSYLLREGIDLVSGLRPKLNNITFTSNTPYTSV